MRLFISLLIAVLLLFQYDFWFGKNGYWDYKNTTKEIAVHQQENENFPNEIKLLPQKSKISKKGWMPLKNGRVRNMKW